MVTSYENFKFGRFYKAQTMILKMMMSVGVAVWQSLAKSEKLFLSKGHVNLVEFKMFSVCSLDLVGKCVVLWITSNWKVAVRMGIEYNTWM